MVVNEPIPPNTHMLVRLAKMALPLSFLLDVLTLAIVGSPILLSKYLASPTVLGFFCSDEVRSNINLGQ